MSQKIQPEEPTVPPDGGFGWVIVAASFLTLVIVDGIIFSFGVFFGEIESYYNVNKTQTALIGSLLSGFYLLVGPMVSALANQFGCQKVSIGGAFVAFSGFVLSVFATNTNILCLTYGVIIGIGFGMLYLPAIVMVGVYFNEKRALATGIAVSGSSIGTFMFAQLSKYLIDEYTWKGATLIMAAIVLNCIAAGILFHPCDERVTSKPNLDRQEENLIISDKITNGLPNGLTNKMCEDKKLPVQPIIESDEMKKKSDSVIIPYIVVDTVGQGMYAENNALPPSMNDKLQIPVIKYIKKDSYESLVEINRNSTKTENLKQRSKPIGQQFKPFYRKDIFLSQSSLTLSEIGDIQHNRANYLNEVDNVLDKQWASEHVTMCGCFKISPDAAIILKNMLDLTLLQSPTFILLCLSAFMTFLGILVPFIFIVSYAEECNYDKNAATNLISVIGATNTIGRILSGWASDKLKNKALLLNNIALTMGGVATCICPFVCNYILLCICCGIFGLSVATFASLRSIILVELLGLEKLSNAFGLNILFMGVASILGPPFAGFIYDLTHSYHASFVIAGVFIAFSGLIAFPLPRLRQWEIKKYAAKHDVHYNKLPSIDV